MSEKPTQPKQFGARLEESQYESKVIDRIVEEAGVPGLPEVLVQMPNADFQSLMLNVWQAKAEKTDVSVIRATNEQNTFVQPSQVDPRELLHFDSIAYKHLPEGYKAIELSPLVPFGANNALADISQKRVFSTNRNTEVLADPTTALALHCANERSIRLKLDSKDVSTVGLASSHRAIRQGATNRPGYNQHFKTFTLASSGRDVGFELFEREQLFNHLRAFLDILSDLRSQDKLPLANIEVAFTDVGTRPDSFRLIYEFVATQLGESYPYVNIKNAEAQKTAYYSLLKYAMTAEVPGNRERLPIAGGGTTNWTEKLLGSKKERMLVGSIGSEIICSNFTNN